MDGFAIETERLDRAVRLRLQGTLDGGAAYRLRDRILALDAPVIVDCSRLERLSDFGLGILAMAITEMNREVEFVGLGHHAQRILRAFGLSRAA
ncbi:MAG TPA: STAS domain-containing protein [Fredinandcohnia sp.]|nr:STAS domain-containing protein [Fredinandcohnia sp.]